MIQFNESIPFTDIYGLVFKLALIEHYLILT